MKLHKFISSPWTIRIVGGIGVYFITSLIAALTGKINLLTAMGRVISTLWYAIKWFLAKQVPMWAIPIFIGLVILAVKIVSWREKKVKRAKPVEISPIVPLDLLSIEIGFALLPLVEGQDAKLLNGISTVRRGLALEFGFVIPMVRILDNLRLDPSEYCIKIMGMEVGRAKVKMRHYLAITSNSVEEVVPGESTKDPVFGISAVWISE